MLRITAVGLVLCACFPWRVARAQEFRLIQDEQFDHPTISSGVSWGDVNGDGWADLYISNIELNSDEPSGGRDGKNELYINQQNGTFERTFVVGPVQDAGKSQSATFTDVNGDGKLDLMVFNGVTTPAITQANMLFVSDGPNQWVVPQSGDLFSSKQANVSGSWADYDLDGDLDVIIVDNGLLGENQLFRNEGGGIFMVVEDHPIPPSGRPGRMAAWFDFDDDGDQDLLLITFQFNSSTTSPHFLYLNQLKETGIASFSVASSGSKLSDDVNLVSSMGISLPDIDNDGDQDIHITQGWGASQGVLYRKSGTTVYEREASNLLESSGGFASGACWGDFDNDGDLDVFISTFNAFGQTGRKDRFLTNDGTGQFTSSRTGAIVETNTQAKACAAADYDHDGDLDLFVATGQLPSQNSTEGPEPNRFFENITANQNRWLRIQLVGTTSNSLGIGAKIDVFAEINGKQVRQTRWIDGGPTGDRGQNEVVSHVGLGDATLVDRVSVTWPNGAREELTNLSVNQTLVIREGHVGTGIEPVSFVSNMDMDLTVYPNPSTRTARLGFRQRESGHVTIRLVDMLGRVVYEKKEGPFSIGNHDVEIPVASLAAGHYLATLTSPTLQYRGFVTVRR